MLCITRPSLRNAIVALLAQVHVRAIMGDYLLQILHPLRPKAVHIELRPRGTRADEGEVGVPPVGGESDGDIAGVMGGASDERCNLKLKCGRRRARGAPLWLMRPLYVRSPRAT